MVSIILSCGKAGAESTHTHTELFEILTYLTQLNCKDSTLCMIAGLQLQNVVNSKSKSRVQSLLGRKKTCWGHPGSVVRCAIPSWEGSAGTILLFFGLCPWGSCSHFSIFLCQFFFLFFCTSCKGVLYVWDACSLFFLVMLVLLNSQSWHSFSNHYLAIKWFVFMLPASRFYILGGPCFTSLQHQNDFPSCPICSSSASPKYPRSTDH